MRKFISCLLLAPLLFCAPVAFAKVFQTPSKSYQTQTAPLSITGSSDGKYTFVLSEGGTVDIYKESGEHDKLKVSPEFDTIFSSATGEKIWLSSKKTKKVQEVLVDFVQNFSIGGSPFLGSENAPVTIVAFSDFQ